MGRSHSGVVLKSTHPHVWPGMASQCYTHFPGSLLLESKAGHRISPVNSVGQNSRCWNPLLFRMAPGEHFREKVEGSVQGVVAEGELLPQPCAWREKTLECSAADQILGCLWQRSTAPDHESMGSLF